MKKSLIVALLISTATSAFAQNFDVYLKFNDNTVVKYENIPGSTNTEAFRAMVQQQHPDKTAIIDAKVVPVEPVRPVAVSHQIDQRPEAESNGSSAGKIIGTVLGIVALGYLLKGVSAAKAFPCVLPTDRARDGSLCGGRASSVRPGGR